MEAGVKFRVAMAFFAALGVAEWLTLEGRVRTTALLLLGVFAILTVLRRARMRIEEKTDGPGA